MPATRSKKHRSAQPNGKSKPRANASARKLDDLDWQLIELLRDDGRHQNRELAKLLQVSEPTIASRIRRLRDDGIMLVTVQEDIYRQGFDFQCHAYISVGNRDVSVVSRDLADHPNVTVVTLLLGTPEIMIVFNARDRADMVDLMGQLGRIKGIEHVDVAIALRIPKYESSFANLAHPYVESGQPAGIDSDELDRRIIDALQPDGRLSNREIARQLDVSEATVRQRVKRMQRDNRIRIGVVVDAVKTGFRASAWVRVAVAPRYLEQALTTFAQQPEITYVGETTGAYNVLLVVFGQTEPILMRIANSKVKGCRGVIRFEVLPMVETVKHNFFEVAISGGAKS